MDLLKLILIFLPIPIFGQDWFSGLAIDDHRYQEIGVLPTYSGVKYNEIPLRVDLRAYTPVAADQGDMGTCVGWAVGYGAFTIARAIQDNQTNTARITQQANSAAFIYNQIKPKEADCRSGVFIEDALVLLQQEGDCLEPTFNFQLTSCHTEPMPIAKQEAEQFRIKDFATLFALEEKSSRKIAKTCQVIATKTPIIVGMEVTESFRKILPGTRVWSPTPNEKSIGFHAMVLVGYDNVEKEFELMNSFGSSWGNQGFIKISYQDFARYCRYAYVLLLNEKSYPTDSNMEVTESKTGSLEGEFVFRKPAGYVTRADGTKVPFFEEVETALIQDSWYYQPQNNTYFVGDVFQLVAREIPKGQYAYVFSFNPSEEVNLHFPKNSAAEKSANFVLSELAEIVIPSPNLVLQLSEPGIDHLCILYSSQKILDIEKRLAHLQNLGGPFENRFTATFQDILIPAGSQTFQPNRMAFKTKATSEQNGYAVPIILKIKAQ